MSDVANFDYIHISDFHFSAQPSRNNALSLLRRDLRGSLDTGQRLAGMASQARELGILSVAKPATHVESIVSGVAQFCFQHKNVVDGIVVSGDLATTGMMVDLRPARAFVSDPAVAGFRSELMRPTLAAARRPIYVIPGNHDRYKTNTGATNSRDFDFEFAPHLRNFSGNIGYWVRKKRGRHLAFVYADFTLQNRMDASNKFYAYGQGRVYKDVLDELKQTTLELRAKYSGAPIVWLLHFAPYDCGSRQLELLGWNVISDAAVALKVAATLCGHTHQQTKINVDQHVTYCAGSAGCIDCETDARVHIVRFEVGDDVRVSRQNFKWNARQLAFDILPPD